MAQEPYTMDVCLQHVSVEDYIKERRQEAMKEAIEARDEGARIHEAIEDAYNGHDCNKEYVPHVRAVIDAINELFGIREWYTEQTFASELGYGGTTDLYCKAGEGWSDSIVLDFKTKDFTDKKRPKGYPEQKMQLEACANGVGIPDALIGNVFVSRTEPGLVHIEMYKKETYFEQFKLLLALWKLRNKYDC